MRHPTRVAAAAGLTAAAYVLTFIPVGSADPVRKAYGYRKGPICH